MQPYDALTQEDKQAIESFCKEYARVKIIDLETTLKHWNKNKRTLFKALGGQLRVSFPIKEEMSPNLFMRSLNDIYSPLPRIRYTQNLTYYKNEISKNVSPFISDFFCTLFQYYLDRDMLFSDIDNVARLFSYNKIESGKALNTYIFQFRDKHPLKIDKDTKIVKAIQKVMRYYEYENTLLFEEWRNKISNLQTTKCINQTLVLSIHPLDYMTMSDNNCNWTSCMSWMEHGCYSLGTIEMMNSNMAVVAYLESKNKFKTPATGDYCISNKSWRSLLFVHKKIIVAGKPYPYNNKDLSIKAMTYMRELLKENLHWNYQYINQRYGDLDHWDSNMRLQESARWIRYYDYNYKGQPKHAIWLYTMAMYNDMVCSHMDYWCCRNYVDKTLKLNVSGPATCMSCGERIEEDCGDAGYFSDGVSIKYCDACKELYECKSCETIDATKDIYEIMRLNDFNRKAKSRECYDCLNNKYAYSKKYNMFTYVDRIYLDSIGNGFEAAVFLSYNNAILEEDIKEYFQDKINGHYTFNKCLSTKIDYLDTSNDFPHRNTDYVIYKLPTGELTELVQDINSPIVKHEIKIKHITYYVYAFEFGIKTVDAEAFVEKYKYDFVPVKEMENKDEIISTFFIK